jgi:hypothetical protein
MAAGGAGAVRGFGRWALAVADGRLVLRGAGRADVPFSMWKNRVAPTRIANPTAMKPALYEDIC